MMRSLFSGVSGLKGHQTRMDVIGNNIANVNTTGFKSSRATFADTLSQTLSGASAPGDIGGTNPKQIGLGSSVSSIDTIFTDGSIQSTGKNTDLCLSGNGLFVVSNGTETYYTRNGAFEFDANGNLVMSGTGLFVQGWDEDGKLGNLTVNAGGAMSPSATTSVVYDKNLNANTEGYTIANILATYEDGTTKTLTHYPSSTIKLTTGAGKTMEIDENAFGKFTTGDLLKGTYLYSTTINSVNANGSNLNLKLGANGSVNSITDASGNDLIATVTSGTYSIGDTVSITGTIQTNGVTASGSGTGETELTVKLTSPSELNGTIVKIKVPDPQNFNYKDGDSIDFDLSVEEMTTSVGNKLETPAGEITVEAGDFTTARNNGTTITAASQKFNYYGRDDGSDGDVREITREEGKEAESIVITTTDGQQLKGLKGVNYENGGMFYPSLTTTITVYDSLGENHSIPILLTKKSSNTWGLSLANGGTSTTITDSANNKMTLELESTDLLFDSCGNYISGEGKLNINYDYERQGPENQSINISLAALTQYANGSTVDGTSDGHAAGTLKSVSIDSSGTITGSFSNGLKQTGGQVAVAQFNNAAGLTKTGNSLYTDSNNSGKANIQKASSLGVTITPSALEMSNVDISDQFSDMIITQRGFQSNSKIITVSDEMLETLINMKR